MLKQQNLIHEVTGCRACPYSNCTPSGWFCTLGKKSRACKLKTRLDETEFPRFCPLIKGDVIIKLKKCD